MLMSQQHLWQFHTIGMPFRLLNTASVFHSVSVVLTLCTNAAVLLTAHQLPCSLSHTLTLPCC